MWINPNQKTNPPFRSAERGLLKQSTLLLHQDYGFDFLFQIIQIFHADIPRIKPADGGLSERFTGKNFPLKPPNFYLLTGNYKKKFPLYFLEFGFLFLTFDKNIVFVITFNWKLSTFTTKKEVIVMFCQSVSTPIVKPVNGLCNLSCSYCYASGLKEYAVENRMRLEILKAMIDFFCCDQDDIEFIWHGGEPLLAGLDFYRKAVEFQDVWKQQGKKIANFLQTNATLITPEWTRFFVENDFLVGVSLDGPKEVHDQVRHYPNGKGSYDDVIKGINLLHRAGIFNGIICGISTVNRRFPKEILNFFIEKNIKKLKFARVKNIGHCGDISSLVISPAQYADFMIAIFDHWLELDDPEVEIRDIQSVVNLILGGNQRECIYMGQCDQFVTIYSDGSIYGCDSFLKVDALHFGSVFDGSTVVRSNLRLQSFRELIEERKESCHTCDWYFICKGGCTRSCYEETDSSKPIDEVCENLKRYFEHISIKIRSYNLI